MHSTTPTRVSILPVLDFGPPPGPGAPEAHWGAPFDSLLRDPPPACPPPPQDDAASEGQSDYQLSPEAPRTSGHSQPRAEQAQPAIEAASADAPQTTGEDVTAEATEGASGEETAPEESEAAEVSTAVQSLVAVAAIAPVVLPADPPTAPVGEEADRSTIAPAAQVESDSAPAAQPSESPAPSDGQQGAALDESPDAAVGAVDVAVNSRSAETQAPAKATEPNEGAQSVEQESSASSSETAAASQANEPQQPFAALPAADLASKQQAESIATPAVAPTTESVAAGQSEATAPPAGSVEPKDAPAASARPMHAPGLPSPDAVSGFVPRSRLPAAVLAREPTAGQPSVQIDSVRLLQRVSRALHAAQERGGEIQLRLSPAELGSLRLQVQVVEGALTARVEAESPAARAALIDNLPLLRERLNEQGVRVERFEVDLMQRHSGGAGGSPDRPRDHDRSLPQLPPPTTNVRISAPPQPARATQPWTTGPGRLNVVV